MSQAMPSPPATVPDPPPMTGEPSAAGIPDSPAADSAQVVAAADAGGVGGQMAGCRRLLGVIVAFLVVYTCVLAEVVLVPILIAILIGLVFAPAVRLLERW